MVSEQEREEQIKEYLEYLFQDFIPSMGKKGHLVVAATSHTCTYFYDRFGFEDRKFVEKVVVQFMKEKELI